MKGDAFDSLVRGQQELTGAVAGKAGGPVSLLSPHSHPHSRDILRSKKPPLPPSGQPKCKRSPLSCLSTRKLAIPYPTHHAKLVRFSPRKQAAARWRVAQARATASPGLEPQVPLKGTLHGRQQPGKMVPRYQPDLTSILNDGSFP